MYKLIGHNYSSCYAFILLNQNKISIVFLLFSDRLYFLQFHCVSFSEVPALPGALTQEDGGAFLTSLRDLSAIFPRLGAPT